MRARAPPHARAVLARVRLLPWYRALCACARGGERECRSVVGSDGARLPCAADNGIKAEGAKELAAALKENKALTKLELFGALVPPAAACAPSCAPSRLSRVRRGVCA